MTDIVGTATSAFQTACALDRGRRIKFTLKVDANNTANDMTYTVKITGLPAPFEASTYGYTYPQLYFGKDATSTVWKYSSAPGAIQAVP